LADKAIKMCPPPEKNIWRKNILISRYPSWIDISDLKGNIISFHRENGKNKEKNGQFEINCLTQILKDPIKPIPFFFFLHYWDMNSGPSLWATPPALFLW
jgi:hypothetical protein